MGGIAISVPARAEFVHIVRSVVAGAAAKASLGIDDIEDLRLAVDEACSHLLALAPDASMLTVEIEERPSVIELLAHVDAGVAEGRAADDESITWLILSALTDGARLEPSAGGTAIRMSKQVQSEIA